MREIRTDAREHLLLGGGLAERPRINKPSGKNHLPPDSQTDGFTVGGGGPHHGGPQHGGPHHGGVQVSGPLAPLCYACGCTIS